MGKNWEDKAFDKAFNGVFGLIWGVIGLVITGGVHALTSVNQVDAVAELHKLKRPLPNGVKIDEVSCTSCSTINEVGQIQCYGCGADLHTPISVAKDLSPTMQLPVGNHVISSIVLILLGVILAANFGNGSPILSLAVVFLGGGVIWLLLVVSIASNTSRR